MRTIMTGVILGVVGLIAAHQWPDIQRYMKMRSMARPQNPSR